MDVLLRNIEKKPFNYIGAPSLKKLYLYFQGFELGAISAGKKVYLPMFGFQKWIEKHYNLENTGESWVDIISLYSVDYREGFTVFFPLHRQYCNTLQDYQQKKAITDVSVVNTFNLYDSFTTVMRELKACVKKQRIEDFRVLLDGLLYARSYFELPQTEEEKYYQEFQSWIWEDRQLEHLFPWERIYSFFEKTCEIDAFLHDYDRFLAEKGYPSRA